MQNLNDDDNENDHSKKHSMNKLIINTYRYYNIKLGRNSKKLLLKLMNMMRLAKVK